MKAHEIKKSALLVHFKHFGITQMHDLVI